MAGTTTPVTRTPYRVKAMSVEACSCAHGCNCQFGGTPNEGICEFVLGFDVKMSWPTKYAATAEANWTNGS